MSSRDKILNKLRAVPTPFEDHPAAPERRSVTQLTETDPAALRQRFIEEAKSLKCDIYEAASDSDALEILLDLLGDDKSALMWDTDYIPIHGLDEALQKNDITAASLRDSAVRVGITGADAALAATGSLVVFSGAGRSRQASLLPIEHIAILKAGRIMADLEAFYDAQNHETFKDHSNIAVISGPSKSADIEQTMIHGMHGPGKVHIILVP